MAREPFTFTRTEALPAPARAGGNGVGRTSPYDALIAEVNANAGEWYELQCGSDNQAYSRATTLRKTYGLEAHARNGMVYVRKPVDDGVPAA
jgi:hypothetical protein